MRISDWSSDVCSSDLAAIEAGAGAYLTSADPLGGTAIVVADTLAALQDAGRLARTRLPAPVVGITGSVGTTSVKDMLAAVLRQRLAVAPSERSFNNEHGVPLPWPGAPHAPHAVLAA